MSKLATQKVDLQQFWSPRASSKDRGEGQLFIVETKANPL